MKIGLLGAMPEEVDILRDQMTSCTHINEGERDYYCGQINGIDAVLACSKMGKVAAAITTMTLINRFHTDKLIFTGVAGAVSDRLNIGDVVVAEQLYQHDMDASPLFKRHEIPLTDKTFFQSDPALIELANKSLSDLCNTFAKKTPASILKTYNIDSPKWINGVVASGDQFVSSAQVANRICQTTPEVEVLAVEMEGAAVAQVCDAYNVPFVVIRTISDLANNDATIDFTGFIRDVARQYSNHLIRTMVLQL